ncbi:MAG TPA: hypothetical protein VLJ38_21520, partial [Polyangiaceae bacterium]|nr:hypothetical protein [Polyangiaceae bacterium]
TRIVEKRVLVPVAAPTPVAPEVQPHPAGSVATTQTPPPSNAESPKPAATERVVSKSDASAAPAKSWRKDDPGPLEQAASTSPRHGQRVGFPTNPGF